MPAPMKFLPGPGPLVIAAERSSVSVPGTHTGALAGRFEFQGLIVDDAATSGTPNYRILKRRRT